MKMIVMLYLGILAAILIFFGWHDYKYKALYSGCTILSPVYIYSTPVYFKHHKIRNFGSNLIFLESRYEMISNVDPHGKLWREEATALKCKETNQPLSLCNIPLSLIQTQKTHDRLSLLDPWLICKLAAIPQESL